MKLKVSNSLIIISVIFTISSFFGDDIFAFGMNNYFLSQGDFVHFFLQLCFYSFIHGGFSHLFFNSIFIFYFGNKVEDYLKRFYFIVFFVLITILNAVAILFFSKYNTVGISGFGMALLSFYTLMLYEKKDSEYKGGITAILINIIIGFSGNISLVGHLFGAVFGAIFFYIFKFFKSKKI